MLGTLVAAVRGVLHSPNMPTPRPVLTDQFESNVRGLFIVGDLAGAPVVKLAMEQGDTVARHIANLQNKPSRGDTGPAEVQNKP